MQERSWGRWLRIDTEADDPNVRAYIAPESDHVDLGDGLWMYEGTQVRVRHWDYDIDIDVGVFVGRFVAQRISIERHNESPPVTSEALRRVPVATLVSYAARTVQLGNADPGVAAWPTPEEGEYIAKHGLDDETLRIVARIYRLAYLIGQSPTKKVETLLSIPRSTAGRWVAAARSRGYLSEARGAGKAG